MKIRLSELRRIIREVMDQEAVPPGKWAANTGEPADEEDLERLGERQEHISETDDEIAELDDQAYTLKMQAYRLLQNSDADYKKVAAVYKQAADVYSQCSSLARERGAEHDADCYDADANEMEQKSKQYAGYRKYKPTLDRNEDWPVY